MDETETQNDHESHDRDSNWRFDSMLNCRQVTRLVSQSMDAKLRWYQWLGMRIHLLYCVWCRRYASQIRFLHKACDHLDPETEANPTHTLSSEAKDKMRARLQEAMKDETPSAQ